MLTDLKSLIARNAATLAEDAAGVAALALLLMLGLYLPAL